LIAPVAGSRIFSLVAYPPVHFFSNDIKRALPKKKPACYLPVHSEESPCFFQKKLRLVSKRHSPQKFQRATDGTFRGNPTYEVCVMSNGSISSQNATARRNSNVVLPAHAKEIQDTRGVMLNGTISGFLRLHQILTIIPVSKSTWWAGVKTGRFPRPVKLGPRTTAWTMEDIAELAKRLSHTAGQDR